ncbi:SDR family NAD(P)-dependent oxidoreductase [Patescibacteria group bacterium]|nr:SDR family NAD(P)-dependent oxidoreductase [Patescibacteria group bacterium]MCL5797995.1 SDR family NAD(P)-dependent oxidoreductase [Patescibacteria group bacterium]
MLKYNKILVTGGAGFIGSHLLDGLIGKGYKVRVLDNLYRQIHPTGKLPEYFNKKAEFMKGDVTRRTDWKKALAGVDAVIHLAAAVGVGQSMYEIEHYVKVNSLGTALLLDILANERHTVKKIIVAASMSSYGEGTYRCSKCGLIRPPLRSEEQLAKKDFNVYCPNCKQMVSSVPTNEDAKQNSNSIYAIGKKEQEEMVLTFGKAYGLPSVALRYFNVYGPRQSLSNPYNGVAAIFMSRVKNGKAPIINEDGMQTRDFVHVSDVTAANIAVLEKDEANYQVFNVGSGKPVSIKEVAEIIIKLYKSDLEQDVTYKVRKLDVRHCYADTAKIQELLGWSANVDFTEGISQLIDWGRNEKAVDKMDFALRELEKRGLR